HERQRKAMISAFAFAPACSIGEDIVDGKWGTHLLAVSNPNNQILILQIHSLYHLSRSLWKVEVLQLLDTSMGHPQPLVGSLHSNLAWSPWLKDGQVEVSVLAYLSGYSLGLCKVSVQHTSKRQDGTNSSFAVRIIHEFSKQLE